MQTLIVESVFRILSKAGYKVTDIVETKPRCFDIVARKGDVILLIKVLYNIDSLKHEMAKDMKVVAKLLKASPIVIGEKYKNDYLERGVVYNRYGLPVVNTATFYDFVVEGIYPMVYSAPGGFFVKIDGEKLREMRERLGLSIGDLANILGVSRRTVKKYEGEVDASVETALKLEEVFGVEVIKAIDLLNFVQDENVDAKFDFSGREGEIVRQLECIGVKVYPIKHAPFDVVSQAEEENILTGVRQVKEIDKRATILGRISKVLSTKAVYIVDRKVKVEVNSVVFVMKDELQCLSSPKDFISLLKEKIED
ncbi:transcriptional regulator [Archaeoglobus sp.]